MFEDVIAETYRSMGFPIDVMESDKSPRGIITYPGWGAGFFVVDVDAHYGGLASFEKIKQTVEFPKTVTARTPRGGLHLYYKYPSGIEIPGRIDTINGIDILSEDSQVHMPPSAPKMGLNAYEWINAPQTTTMANPPKSLLKFIGATPL